MKFNKLALATAVTAALAGGTVGTANAVVETAVSQSLMNITNFLIIDSASAPLSPLNFSAFSYNDDLSNTAVLNGKGAFETANVNAKLGDVPLFKSPTDALMACVGPGCGAPPATENNFSSAALNGNVPPASLFARGDSFLSGAPLANPTVPIGVTANTVSETSLNAGGNKGNATSDILLTSTIAFSSATKIKAGDLGLAFNAETLIRTWTGPGTTLGTSAGAGYKWEIQLKQGDTVLIDWIPDGNTGTGTQQGLTVSKEGCDLENNSSAAFNEQQAATTCTGGFLAFTSIDLAADTIYSFSITQHVITNAITNQSVKIPEPATLALLGAGLVGLGFSRRRKTA